MAEKPESPEAVALELYRKVVDHEFLSENKPKMDREYILSTYSECLRAATGAYETPNEKAEMKDSRPMITKL